MPGKEGQQRGLRKGKEARSGATQSEPSSRQHAARAAPSAGRLPTGLDA